MRQGWSSLAAVALFAAALPIAAQAQAPRPITVTEGTAWRHHNSGLSMPATLAGFPRTQVREYEAPELDVVGTWQRDDDELTVYVYRSTAGSVPVWFDRASWAIEGRAIYGKITPAQVPAAIGAPGASANAGLIASWTTEGQYRGTAVAILPLGEWLVKLRYTSTTRDGAAAAEVARTAVASLGWPDTIPAAPAAQPIANCPNRLAFKGEAKAAKIDGSTAILMAAAADLPQLSAARGREADWCRDAATLPNAGVYRPRGSDNSYLLALSDAGRGIWVAPSIGALFAANNRPQWSVELVLPGRMLSYPPQDRLPRPDRALALSDGDALASTSTFGDEQAVTLPPR